MAPKKPLVCNFQNKQIPAVCDGPYLAKSKWGRAKVENKVDRESNRENVVLTKALDKELFDKTYSRIFTSTHVLMAGRRTLPLVCV